MKQSLPLFLAHLRVCIAEYEADRREEVTLARAIAPNNDIVLGGERFYHSLLLVAKPWSATL